MHNLLPFIQSQYQLHFIILNNESGLKSQIFFQEKPYIIDMNINNKFTKNYTIFYQSTN